MILLQDALTLQRVLLQTKTELMGDQSSGVPDVQSLVREILTNLFVSLANYQDEEGRCFSDSLNEVPFDKESMKEKDENNEGQKWVVFWWLVFLFLLEFDSICEPVKLSELD